MTSALQELSIGNIIVTEVRACGREPAWKRLYRGAQYEVLLPILKLETLVTVDRLPEAIGILAAELKPGEDCGGSRPLMFTITPESL